MYLYNIKGRHCKKNVNPFRIKWDKKCRSIIQDKVKQFLRQYWAGDSVFEEFPVYGTRLKVDILNASKKIAVEIQGKQHYAYNKFFHKGKRSEFFKSIQRDVTKIEWLESNGFKVIEVKEEEIDQISLEYFKETFGIDIING